MNPARLILSLIVTPLINILLPKPLKKMLRLVTFFTRLNSKKA